MSVGMAEVIAAHWVKELPSTQLLFELQCQGPGCSWGGKLLYTDHAAHVAEELTRAGYGNVQEAKAEALTDAAEEFGAGTWNDVYMIADVQDDADAARATAEWLRKRGAALNPDPLAAALNDPEGHALVQAIHDGKAEGTTDHTMWCRGVKHEGPCQRGRASGTEA